MQEDYRSSLRHNWIVNLLDGGFFGLALGTASFITILPLFVSSMTSSAILIGLIPAIHSMGWQLPQLATVSQVSRQRRLKPMVLLMTLNERIPFLGLALIAWLLPQLGSRMALLLTFILLVWQGIGGGLTATAWQSMIAKIMPSNQRGTFYGAQSAIANLLASLGAILAGLVLDRLPSPQDFTVLFLLASLAMAASWVFLAQNREPDRLPLAMPPFRGAFINSLRSILRRDRNFRWFVLARILSQIGVMGFAFYTIYAVKHHGVGEVEIGLMTGVLMGTQIGANLVLGWIGDRWSHRTSLSIGTLAGIASALLAWIAPAAGWFYLVFALAGVASAAVWTVALAMVLEFGTEAERPAYIGLGNTLVAPMTILAPLLGGWLADRSGYPSAFLASTLGGLATLLVLLLYVRDPRHIIAGAAEYIPGD